MISTPKPTAAGTAAAGTTNHPVPHDKRKTHVACPFKVLVDVQEKHPWSFTGIKSDADKKHREWLVPTETISLGPAQGDYQIAGLRGRFSVERKSIDDVISTVLGWSERRERWERELETLAGMEGAVVVVEGSLQDVLAEMPATTSRSKERNQKSFLRSYQSWSVGKTYRVPWWFAWGGRRMAEIWAFRALMKFWELARKADRAEKNLAKNSRKEPSNAQPIW